MNPDDIPVFDRGRAFQVIGRPSGGLRTSALDSHAMSSSRNAAKPGRPVPFGEPDPDRFAKSELIRRSLEEQDARRAARRVEMCDEDAMAERRAVDTERKAAAELNCEEPDTSYCCELDMASVKAERGDRVLYFPTTRAAELAMGGAPSTARIKKALAMTGRDWTVYGWRWTRLADGRRHNRVRNKL